MEWDDLGFILASNYRKKVFIALKENTLTPKQISESTNIRIVHVSRTLKELLQKNIVTCLTPKRIKGRLYQLTEKANQLLKFL